ncbi:6510_t:CDS:2, partial [Racocetra persica]
VIKMVKREFLLILTILLFNASSSFSDDSLFNGDAIFDIPKVVGNYDISQNMTPPDGHVFKFYTYVSGSSVYQCSNKSWLFYESRAFHFNNEKDLHSYPTSAVASTFKNTGISILSGHDDSSLITGAIVAIPKSDHPEDIPLGLEKVSYNRGKGAFEDITYIVRPRTRSGNDPSTLNIPSGVEMNEVKRYSMVHVRVAVRMNMSVSDAVI